MSVKYINRDLFLSEAVKSIKQTEVVLDVGCGIMPQPYVRPSVHICAEPFLQYMENLQEKVRHQYDRTFIFLNSTWEQTLKIFPNHSVDTVMLLDVIEHLDKSESLRLLKETERIVRRQIVIFTTLGFIPQHHTDGKDAWGLDGGTWQEHKSGWDPSDFDKSWDVYVCENYHQTNNIGVSYEKPRGAIWAIKNLSSKSENAWTLAFRNFSNILFRSKNLKLLFFITLIAGFVERIQNFFHKLRLAVTHK